MSDVSGVLASGVRVEVEHNKQHTFTCNVACTKPAATIEWLLGSVSQLSIISVSSRNRLDGLTDVTSTWTFTPSVADHGKEVKCVAKTPRSEMPFPSATVVLTVTGLFYRYLCILLRIDPSRQLCVCAIESREDTGLYAVSLVGLNS